MGYVRAADARQRYFGARFHAVMGPSARWTAREWRRPDGTETYEAAVTAAVIICTSAQLLTECPALGASRAPVQAQQDAAVQQERFEEAAAVRSAIAAIEDKDSVTGLLRALDDAIKSERCAGRGDRAVPDSLLPASSCLRHRLAPRCFPSHRLSLNPRGPYAPPRAGSPRPRSSATSALVSSAGGPGSTSRATARRLTHMVAS